VRTSPILLAALPAFLIAGCGARSDLGAPFVVAAGPGCAAGVRQGFVDAVRYPDIAACAGSFTGTIGEASAQAICAAGWHVCRGDDAPVRRITQAEATQFPGCFAFDAADDCGACYPTCVGSHGMCQDGCCVSLAPTDPDMAGMGASCTPNPLGFMTSCLAEGRLDASTNTFGCGWDPSLAGVVCCAG
jgi:hypothetical protein